MAKNERFEKVYSQGAVNIMEIWIDKETGVNYVFHASGYSGGMTPLLDKDGKPIISPIVNQVNSSLLGRHVSEMDTYFGYVGE